MFKIAVVDDDEFWSLAIQRFFRQEFEVFVFNKVSNFLRTPCCYDLVIVDFSIPNNNYELEINGCQLINNIKSNLATPPILVLATGFISKNQLEIGQKICPAADAFFAKDAGLEAILAQVKNLLASKRKHTFQTTE